MRVTREFSEVLSLLRMSNSVIHVLWAQHEDRPRTWDHGKYPVVYINTMDSLIAIPQVLFQPYAVTADFYILFLHRSSNSFPTL